MSNTTRFTPDPYVPEFMQKIQAAAGAESAILSRRNFIKIGGVAGGGLVLALSLGPAARNAFAQTASNGTFTANPYVQIKSDGTVV